MAVVGLGDQVYVGRQAVFDSRRRVMGYELLYRHGTENRAIVSDGVEATRSVVAAAMMEFGLEHLVRDGLAFVNVTREFLATGMHRALPPDRVVLEVLEDEVADADLIELLGAVRAEGYRLALDDFTVGSDHGRLIGLAEIVKVDLLATPRDRLAGLVVDLRSRGVTVLAEKVETPADLEAVRGLGVDLVQGFFFQRPEVLAGRKVSIGELPAVRLLASVDDPDVSAVELETIIVCDPALTYRLLRLANSPAAGTTRPVTSLRGALVLLGRQTIKNLAVLAMIHGAEGKTSELATTAMVRAKMCEQLAVPTSAGSAPAAFLVGLLSVLDAVFDAPIAGLVEQLALSEDIAAAVVDHRGHLGALLDIAVAYERADPALIDPSGPFPATALQAYVAAVAWADATMRTLAAPDRHQGVAPAIAARGARSSSARRPQGTHPTSTSISNGRPGPEVTRVPWF